MSKEEIPQQDIEIDLQSVNILIEEYKTKLEELKGDEIGKQLKSLMVKYDLSMAEKVKERILNYSLGRTTLTSIIIKL